MAKRGKFIVIEGIDGSGKSSQIELLKGIYEDMGRSNEFYFTAEPTKSEVGKKIREILSSNEEINNSVIATLFFIDRIKHITDKGGINDILDKGINVICDRYYYSNIVYQGYGEYEDFIYNMHRDCPDILTPDLVIHMSIDPEIALQRINKGRKPEELERYETLEKLTETEKKYSDLIVKIDSERRPDENITLAHIPADKDIETVFKWIYSIIEDVIREEKERYCIYKCFGTVEQIAELKNHLLMNGYDFSVNEKDGLEISIHEDGMDYIQTIMDDRGIDYRIIDFEWKIKG